MMNLTSDNMNNMGSAKASFCESLFGLLLPSLYASIRLGGLNSFQELIARLNHSATMTNWPASSSSSSSANSIYRLFNLSTTSPNFDYFSKLVTHPCDPFNHMLNHVTHPLPPNDSFASVRTTATTTTTANPMLMNGGGGFDGVGGGDLPASVRCTLVYNYTLDLANYFQICNQIESNLVYFEWLVGLFTPLIYALCSMFLLPSVVVLLLYASSLFMFLTKHWNKLKVSKITTTTTKNDRLTNKNKKFKNAFSINLFFPIFLIFFFHLFALITQT